MAPPSTEKRATTKYTESTKWGAAGAAVVEEKKRETLFNVGGALRRGDSLSFWWHRGTECPSHILKVLSLAVFTQQPTTIT
jgi:hypothetical protein